MSTSVLLASVLGAGFGLGVCLLLVGLRIVRAADPTPDPDQADADRGGWLGRLTAGRRRSARRALAAVAAGVLVGVGTRWPVAGVLAACGVWVLPELIGPDREHRRRLARIEAIATWTEMLRDTISAAAGLEQAITATAQMAPSPIHPEIGALAGRLRRGDRLGDALRQLAVDLDDPTGDLVAAALIMAAERHARHVADLLTSLAAAARDQAALRMRTAAGRARVRTSVRVVVSVTVGMAVGLVLLNRGYLAPYDSALGQLMLTVIGVLFAGSFWWLARIATTTNEPRVLTGLHPLRQVVPS